MVNSTFGREFSSLYLQLATLVRQGLPSHEVAEYESRAATYDAHILAGSDRLSSMSKFQRWLEAAAREPLDRRGLELECDQSSRLDARERAYVFAYSRNLPPLYFFINSCETAAAAHGVTASTASFSADTAAAMAKLPRFHGKLFRAMGPVEQDQYPTHLMRLVAFLSCTSEREQASPFAGKQEGGKTVLILVSEGAVAARMGRFAINESEAEVVCTPGSYVCARRDAQGMLMRLVVVPAPEPRLVVEAESAAGIVPGALPPVPPLAPTLSPSAQSIALLDGSISSASSVLAPPKARAPCLPAACTGPYHSAAPTTLTQQHSHSASPRLASPILPCSPPTSPCYFAHKSLSCLLSSCPNLILAAITLSLSPPTLTPLSHPSHPHPHPNTSPNTHNPHPLPQCHFHPHTTPHYHPHCQHPHPHPTLKQATHDPAETDPSNPPLREHVALQEWKEGDIVRFRGMYTKSESKTDGFSCLGAAPPGGEYRIQSARRRNGGGHQPGTRWKLSHVAHISIEEMEPEDVDEHFARSRLRHWDVLPSSLVWVRRPAPSATSLATGPSVLMRRGRMLRPRGGGRVEEAKSLPPLLPELADDFTDLQVIRAH